MEDCLVDPGDDSQIQLTGEKKANEVFERLCINTMAKTVGTVPITKVSSRYHRLSRGLSRNLYNSHWLSFHFSAGEIQRYHCSTDWSYRQGGSGAHANQLPYRASLFDLGYCSKRKCRHKYQSIYRVSLLTNTILSTYSAFHDLQQRWPEECVDVPFAPASFQFLTIHIYLICHQNIGVDFSRAPTSRARNFSNVLISSISILFLYGTSVTQATLVSFDMCLSS